MFTSGSECLNTGPGEVRVDWRSGAAGHFHEQGRPLPPGAAPLPSTADLTLAVARASPQPPNPDPSSSHTALAPGPPAGAAAAGAGAVLQPGSRGVERAVDEDVDLLVAWEAEGDARGPPRMGLHHLYRVRPQVPAQTTCCTVIVGVMLTLAF